MYGVKPPVSLKKIMSNYSKLEMVNVSQLTIAGGSKRGKVFGGGCIER